MVIREDEVMATVVVVEDDQGILSMMTEALDMEGFEVVPSDGSDRDAVKAVERTNPDVVVLDNQLPGMSGVQIAREIHARPELAHVRVIAMTAAGGMAHICQLMEADACLGKPFDLDDLLNVVSQSGLHTH